MDYIFGFSVSWSRFHIYSIYRNNTLLSVDQHGDEYHTSYKTLNNYMSIKVTEKWITYSDSACRGAGSTSIQYTETTLYYQSTNTVTSTIHHIKPLITT